MTLGASAFTGVSGVGGMACVAFAGAGVATLGSVGFGGSSLPGFSGRGGVACVAFAGGGGIALGSPGSGTPSLPGFPGAVPLATGGGVRSPLPAG